MPITTRLFSALLLVILFLPVRPIKTVNSAGSLPGSEADLNPNGAAYEINPDPTGQLWISDYGANEIWRINPGTSEYTVFSPIPSPSDARADASGNLWWADFDHGRLGHLPVGASQPLSWALPASVKPYGTLIDPTGRVWVSDSKSTSLYRYDPTTGDLCAYFFPDAAAFSYLAGNSDALWVADINNARLYRLAYTSGQFTYWTLPSDSAPQSLVARANGGVVWIDLVTNAVARFDPSIDTLTSYELPSGTYPAYLTADGERYWFTQQFPQQFGLFDPFFATGAPAELEIANPQVQQDCKPAEPAASQPISTRQDTLAWTPSSYPTAVDTPAWRVYSLPSEGSPGGIAYLQNSLWIVDSQRKKLISIQFPQHIFLPITLKP